MWRSARTAALLVVVVAAALLPLYGDPRAGNVTHPEWARMILRGLDLLDPDVPVSDFASQVFGTLSGRNSWTFAADRYVKSTGIQVDRGANAGRVRATAPVGEVQYAVAVARGGEWRLRLRAGGEPSTPLEAEVGPFGESPEKTFRVTTEKTATWLDAGSVHLDPGAYSAAVLLPVGSVLERLELTPPCVAPIEPRKGWEARAVATRDDVAVTTLQAIEGEFELPPADTPIEAGANRIRVESGPTAATAALYERAEIVAGPKGLRIVVMLEVPEGGLYTLSVFGSTGAGGQGWTADGCMTRAICPSPDPSLRWRSVLSTRLTAGPHSFTAALGAGAIVGRVRLERKKETEEDYVATLRRLGLDLGETGGISREKAIEARRFLGERRSAPGLEFCGEIIPPGELETGTAVAASGGSGAQPGPAPGPGPGPGPGPNPPPPPPPVVPPPVIPPPDVASPVQPQG